MSRLKVIERTGDRVILQDGNKTAVVKLDFQGQKQKWLLTAYEVSAQETKQSIGSSGFTNATSPMNRADGGSIAKPTNPQLSAQQ